MNHHLARVADDLTNGRSAPPVTTREFLSWFNVQRRGFLKVIDIRAELAEARIVTEPDFESAYIDSPIEFRVSHQLSADETSLTFLASEAATEAADPINIPTWINKDPTYRISKLAAANKEVKAVKPDSSLAEAITIMLSNNFSQLPVMTTPHVVKGVVSWKSIGSRFALKNTGQHVRDFMDPHCEIRSESSIFEAIPVVNANQYVLVRGGENKVVGIITSADLGIQFGVLAEPFLLLGEIENFLRAMISDHFSVAELESVRAPSDIGRAIQSADDLNFGEYIRLLESDERWTRLNISIDRKEFCSNLHEIRDIRNDVMHFDPDPLPDDLLLKLRNFASFLKQLQSIMRQRT